MVFEVHVQHAIRKTTTVAHFYIKPWNPCGSGENGHRKPCNCRVFMLKIDATLAFWHIDCHHSHTDSTRLRHSTFKNTDSCTLLCKTMDSVWEWWKSMCQNTSVASFFNIKMWQLHCFRCPFTPLPYGIHVSTKSRFSVSNALWKFPVDKIPHQKTDFLNQDWKKSGFSAPDAFWAPPMDKFPCPKKHF